MTDTTSNQQVLFIVQNNEGKQSSVFLKKYSSGTTDLVIPHVGVSGLLERAERILQQRGLKVLKDTRDCGSLGTYYTVVADEGTKDVQLKTLFDNVKLVRTGKMVSFLELHIGQAFFYIDAFWTRTDTYAGTDLRPRGKGLEPAPCGTTWGSCSFGCSPDTLMVEEVRLEFDVLP